MGRRARDDQPAARAARARASPRSATAAARASRSFLQVHLSWAPDERQALDIAYDQWRTNLFQPPLPWDLHTVEQFDEAARFVRPEDVRSGVLVSADLEQHAAWLQEFAELGFEAIYLHHVGQELEPFIDAFGERVLPALA